MKSELEIQLKNVKEEIGRVIAEDTFPDAIEPELLREAVRAYPMRGGKRLRPALLLWSCGAAGGELEKAVCAAAAVEIYHNWTLVHDDIIDRDEFRRGQPTCHIVLAEGCQQHFAPGEARSALYGTDMAILAGDVQQAWAANLLLKTPVSDATKIAIAGRMHTFLNRTLISGEALDIEFEFRSSYPEQGEIRKMIAGKTGALLSYCTETGGMIGLDTPDVNHPVVRALSGYAKSLGHAFQLQDDLLGLYGDEASFGKPIGSDFRERKPTILHSEALRRLDKTGLEKLQTLTGLERYGEAEIQNLRELMEICGARKAVIDEMNASTETALSELKKLSGSSWRDLLEELAHKLCSRKV